MAASLVIRRPLTRRGSSLKPCPSGVRAPAVHHRNTQEPETGLPLREDGNRLAAWLRLRPRPSAISWASWSHTAAVVVMVTPRCCWLVHATHSKETNWWARPGD